MEHIHTSFTWLFFVCLTIFHGQTSKEWEQQYRTQKGNNAVWVLQEAAMDFCVVGKCQLKIMNWARWLSAWWYVYMPVNGCLSLCGSQSCTIIQTLYHKRRREPFIDSNVGWKWCWDINDNLLLTEQITPLLYITATQQSHLPYC